ncbi:efflux RND transporter periplasmic adaptor subunit [bacterium]|nr:efflux RND transporter periplasmic adaptor subunit [bacterium]
MIKKAVILILIIFIGLCTYCYKSNNKETINELTLYGNIEIRQIDLSFLAGGQIKELKKEEGDTVQKDELIATLDSRDYESEYEKASAEVDRTLAIKEDALSKYQRNKNLGKAGAVSEQDVETLFNNKNRTSAEYKIAQANKAYAKNQLDYTKLYAPEDGIIMVRVVEPGSNVAKGQPVYTMAKTNPVWVRAYVNETDLGNIKYGQEVNVYTDTTNPNTGKRREYKGQIGYISPVAEFTPKTVQSTDTRTNLVYRIRVYINDIDEYLRQGMPVTIKINLISKDNQENNADGNN